MAFIYNLTDSWTDSATTWNGIKLAVTNTLSDSSSKLLNLTVSGATTASFVVDKSGNLDLNGKINKITFTAPATAATFTLADNSTFATVGAHSATFTFTGTTAVTFPTSGTVTALGNTTTGTGSIVLATGPTITLDNATGLPVSTGISGFGTGVATALGVNVGLAGSFVVNGGALGTPSSGTLTNCTGYTVGNISGLGSGVATWLATPSSANLAAAVTDETGSGSLVFGTNPTIGSPTITGTAAFNGATSGSVSVKAPAVAGTTTFQLPSSNGTSGYVLVTDGLGNTSWAASGGAVGSAAGLDKNVQFNDAGSMAGNAAFNFDKATDTLSLGVASTTTGSFALYNSASANSVTIKSGNNSAAWTMTLPTSAGTNGYAMVTDGSGNMSWSAIAAGTINTGSAGQITYYSGTNALSGTTTGTGVLTALGINVGSSGAFVAQDGALGAPSSGTLTNCTGLPISTGVSGLGANVATFLATPSSANLAAAVTDETGSGSLVFATSPSLTTPTLGVASATSINKVAITAPATGSTLTIADGKTLTASNTLTFTGTDSSSVAFGTGGTVAYTANNLSVFASTTSAQLAGVISDETGSGSLVFATSPTLTTPRIAGSSTGYTSLASANSSASNYTVTFPAETMTVGFRNIPAVGTKTTSYTLAVGDVGKYVQVGTSGSITIPDATFAEGDVVSVFNNTTGAITITCTITTAYIAGTDSDKASVSLATRGVATILFISGTVCVISGNVS